MVQLAEVSTWGAVRPAANSLTAYAVVVVRRGAQFLLVQESHPGQPWYLPAGHVEPGESFAQAAVRETWEESGLAIRLTGILQIVHNPGTDTVPPRLRVVFLAEPADNRPPKSAPDEHSQQARWLTREEIALLPLRGRSVLPLLEQVDQGCPLFPLDLLTVETLGV